jgi:hypothetical protein
MSSLDDRILWQRKPIIAAPDFFLVLVLALSVTGLLLGGLLAWELATEPVLLAWANPV